ncbi:MAG: hypothetical protein HKO79_00770, partial [Desulfobacterales bacterium]|nr:hypothetical protein [Desulfobacterales bacterium]
MNNKFHENEIAMIKRKNKKTNQTELHPFPMVGGRLRLFHEDLEKYDAVGSNCAGGVESEIVSYKDDVAIIKARVAVNGNAFTATGMASKSRDRLIYPAIVELAETRAIARALRFAGYGVEFTGAEEMPLDIPGVGSTDDTDKVSGKVSGDRNAPPKSPPQSTPQVGGKKEVWERIKAKYHDVDQDALKNFTADFIKQSLKKQSCSSDELMVTALKRWDEFERAFTWAIQKSDIFSEPPEADGPGETRQEREPDPEPEPQDKSEMRKAYEAKRNEVTKEKVILPPKEPEPEKVASEGKLKAKLFMGLPDGVNVKAINSFIDHVKSSNDGATVSDVCQAGIDDPERFIELMVEHCLSIDLDPGFKTYPPDVPETVPETVPEKSPEVSGKKGYSDFRKEWINLTWDRFNKYLLKNASRFQADEEEYNAAVAKYEKLAKNKSLDIPFPFLFNYTEISTDGEIVLDPEQSIIKE